MTLALGFTCVDGLVLAADTQYSSDVSKRVGPKVWLYRVPVNAARPDVIVGVTGAGDVGFLHYASERVHDGIQRRGMGPDDVQSVVQGVISDVIASYNADLNLLVAIWQRKKNGWHRRLIKTMGAASSKAWNYEAFGSGSDLAAYILERAYTDRLTVASAVFWATDILRHAKQHAVGVGGPTDVAVVSDDGEAGFVRPEMIGSLEEQSEALERNTQGTMRSFLEGAPSVKGTLAEPLIAFTSPNHPPRTAIVPK